MATKVYVVGGPEAPKTNQWDHMTNSVVEANKLREGIEGGQMKEIVVRAPYRGKRK